MTVERIKEPTKASEFEVQAYVWSELRKLGINARGEVKVKYMQDGNKRDRCRFDIAVFEDGYLVGIIEIKANVVTHKTNAGWIGTRQGHRYTSFGVPVEIIYGQAEAELFISNTRESGRINWA